MLKKGRISAEELEREFSIRAEVIGTVFLCAEVSFSFNILLCKYIKYF